MSTTAISADIDVRQPDKVVDFYLDARRHGALALFVNQFFDSGFISALRPCRQSSARVPIILSRMIPRA